MALDPDLVIGFSNLQADIARELIARGIPLFPELRCQHDARNRIVDAAAVRERDPEIVIASWCGKKVNKQTIRSREGWAHIRHVYEIKSTYVLQPGPAALTEGVRQLHTLIAAVVGCSVPAALRPAEKTDPDLKGAETRTPGT